MHRMIRRQFQINMKIDNYCFHARTIICISERPSVEFMKDKNASYVPPHGAFESSINMTLQEETELPKLRDMTCCVHNSRGGWWDWFQNQFFATTITKKISHLIWRNKKLIRPIMEVSGRWSWPGWMSDDATDWIRFVSVPETGLKVLHQHQHLLGIHCDRYWLRF